MTSLQGMTCWLNYLVCVGAVWSAKQLIADNLPIELTPLTDLHGAGAGFVYGWKQSKNMNVARSTSAVLLIEP